MSDHDQIEWLARYPINCPACAAEFDCAPSLFHQMGMYDMGGGFCPECREQLTITFIPETNSMTTAIYSIVTEAKQ